MILVLGAATVRPEHRTDALALGREHSARSRTEPGCLDHNVHEDAESPGRIVFVERWSDMVALKAHFGGPASRAFVATLRAWASAPPTMTIYEANEVRP